MDITSGALAIRSKDKTRYPNKVRRRRFVSFHFDVKEKKELAHCYREKVLRKDRNRNLIILLKTVFLQNPCEIWLRQITMETNRKYNIIFRACDLVLAVNKNPRPFDLKKTELIKICFLSLVDSLKGVDTKIIILGDKLSEEMIRFFKRFDVELRLGNFGNEASIQETFKIASTIPEHEWIYFCEDDYLHIPNAFSLIDNFIEQGNELFAQKKRWYNLSSFYTIRDKDLFIYPSDYPDRYLPKFRKHSLIVVSSDCHWRQINSVTFTFLTKVSTVKKHFGLFMKSSEKARDRMFSRKLFGRIGWGFWTSSVCFSPLPGLSTHMHRDTMTPLIKWDTLVEEYRNKIKELNY